MDGGMDGGRNIIMNKMNVNINKWMNKMNEWKKTIMNEMNGNEWNEW